MSVGDGAAVPKRGRWGPVDATRGFAMVLVCLSHFIATYFKGTPYPATVRLLDALTKVATPTFLLLSGAMLGLAHASRSAPRPRIWLRSADRGLFLLLVARPLIFLAHVPLAGDVWRTTRWMFATDTIAVCLLVGPGVAFALRPKARMAAAVGLFVASWWAAVSWTPSGAAQLGKEILVGDLRPQAMAYTFPLLQWLSVYLAGATIGERLWTERTRGPRHAARLAARLGLASMAMGVVSYGVHLGARADTLLSLLSAPGNKVPPGPAFLLFYGGTGLVVLAFALEVDRRRLLERWRGVLALLGRNSLLAFVFQYFVYTAVFLIRPVRSAAWPLWFIASLAAVIGTSALWERRGGYRWMTVGISPRRALAAAAVPSDVKV